MYMRALTGDWAGVWWQIEMLHPGSGGVHRARPGSLAALAQRRGRHRVLGPVRSVLRYVHVGARARGAIATVT